MSGGRDIIRIRGARVHNLQNVDVEIPRGRLVGICGPSGSGKSSLAFDVLFAEGQRRYIESLSAYARQFLQRLEKPLVESIEGLSPAVAIQQKGMSSNPRSTVGTITEVHDFLRLLFARLGRQHCPRCGRPLERKTRQEMVEAVLALAAGTRLAVLAPVVRHRQADHRTLIGRLRKKGFSRIQLDGRLLDLEEVDTAAACPAADISVYVDRLVVRDGIRQRLSDSLETALELAGGVVLISVVDGEDLTLTESHLCLDCDIEAPEPSPALFSFNSPEGACPACGGLGEVLEQARPAARGRRPEPDPVEEVKRACPACGGARLRKEALNVRLEDRSLADLCRLALGDLCEFLAGLNMVDARAAIAAPILREISSRLDFMKEVGLGYLTLDRSAATLSGGEAQRIRLATQMGAALAGVLYVLDEPTVGMHARDRDRMLETLRRLRDRGNTVLVVEHDAGTLLACDHLVEMGPGAGRLGGKVVAEGTPAQILSDPHSLTGDYLAGRKTIELPARRRRPRGWLRLEGARGNNLADLDVEIPLGVLCCVTGVSGSGKSSLVIDTLYRALAARLHRSLKPPLVFTRLSGAERLEKAIYVDQAPLGRTPRSNPATYAGLWGPIRELFARLPESRVRGWGPSRFSFNVKGGRCEACQGAGQVKIEMHFLPDMFVTCGICRGRRFDAETLGVAFRGRNISQVLELTVSEAAELFANQPPVAVRLKALLDVGLGYLELGQSATTLSGGEAQRVKLARELSRACAGRSLYLLDEPTTGLHPDDIRLLLDVLDRLVEQNNTVLVIEHNLDVIKRADFVIDLGPEGGAGGGRLVARGTPEEIASSPSSYTGRYLKEVLA